MYHTAATVGIALAVCCIAVGRARGGSSRRRPDTAAVRRPKGNGFVDLIRAESQGEEATVQPSLTRAELAAGRLVVVIIGPSSTVVHQSYVVNKLLRYLRWSNLIRRHFRLSDEGGTVSSNGSSSSSNGGSGLGGGDWASRIPHQEASSDSVNDLTDSEGSYGSSNRDRALTCPSPPPPLEHPAAGPAPTASLLAPPGLNGSLARTNGNGSGGGIEGGIGSRGGGASAGGARVNGKGCGGGSARHKTHGYTFSDRGKAAALTTISVQESAKEVAAWLDSLQAGGVAVVEAGGSGWASTRQGRAALPGFLRQTKAPPDLGILWVELLPSGLHHRAEPPPSPQIFPAGGSGVADIMGQGEAGASWKSANGLSRGVGMPATPGGNVVETFVLSGNLVGAGGHVIYESVRRGPRGEVGGKGVGKGGKGCFVSLADEGLDVQSQLEDENCPLVRRVGTFAAALRMKKSWHGCPVYLTRHGESLGNQTRSMGGDFSLSENGDRYAGVLARFVAAQPDAGQSRLLVWCSPMKRAVQTARAVKCHQYTQWEALTELDTGVFNGFSYKQVESEHPEEFAAREVDKLCYRYPEGEGYLDVVNRLHPVVVALERVDRPVLIVSHQAVLRCLYAYFHDLSLRIMPRIPISLHTVVKFTPIDYQHHPAPDAAPPRFWKELRLELIKPTPLEQLAEAAVAMNGGKGRRAASQLGESLS